MNAPSVPVRPSLSNPQIFLAACVAGLMVPHTLLRFGYPNSVPDDSAVYAYVGWAMSKGKVPYVDAWDHKGPLLYLFQWLGAVISHVPGRGMSILDLVIAIFSMSLLLWVICRMVSRPAALLIALAGVFFSTYYGSGGDMTETWAVPFLAIAHLAAWRAAKNEWSWTLGAMAGAATAAIFWIRPNMAAFAGLAAVYIVYRSFRTSGVSPALVQVAAGAVSAVAVCGVSLFYYVKNGAIPAMKAAYFGYNVAYSQLTTNIARKSALGFFIFDLSNLQLPVIALAGWAILAWSLLGLEKKGTLSVPKDYRILLLGAAVIEFMTCIMSGRPYGHYLYTLLPMMLILSALAVDYCENLSSVNSTERSAISFSNRRLIVLLLLIVSVQPIFRYTHFVGVKPAVDTPAVIRLIQQVTTPSDRVALLGGPLAADAYLHSQRFATSPFFYTLPLSHVAFPNAAQVRETYVAGVLAAEPKLIASAPPGDDGSLCQTKQECAELNTGLNKNGYDIGALENMLQPLLAEKYVRVQGKDFGLWKVYVRRDVATANGL
jgi:hypothetical protein